MVGRWRRRSGRCRWVGPLSPSRRAQDSCGQNRHHQQQKREDEEGRDVSALITAPAHEAIVATGADPSNLDDDSPAGRRQTEANRSKTHPGDWSAAVAGRPEARLARPDSQVTNRYGRSRRGAPAARGGGWFGDSNRGVDPGWSVRWVRRAPPDGERPRLAARPGGDGDARGGPRGGSSRPRSLDERALPLDLEPNNTNRPRPHGRGLFASGATPLQPPLLERHGQPAGASSGGGIGHRGAKGTANPPLPAEEAACETRLEQAAGRGPTRTQVT